MHARGKDDVTFVIPVYVIQELKQVGYRNILVVNGYSTDGTLKVRFL